MNTLDKFKEGLRVQYQNERGTVSSVNSIYVFVRFDEQVCKFGYENTTAKACKPQDLIIL